MNSRETSLFNRSWRRNAVRIEVLKKWTERAANVFPTVKTNTRGRGDDSGDESPASTKREHGHGEKKKGNHQAKIVKKERNLLSLSRQKFLVK
jgi:hypothetical protein